MQTITTVSMPLMFDQLTAINYEALCERFLFRKFTSPEIPLNLKAIGNDTSTIQTKAAPIQTIFHIS